MPATGLGFEITELRLGLPGGGGGSSGSSISSNNINNGGSQEWERSEKKRTYSEISSTDDNNHKSDHMKKSQVAVGWPPVCSYRRRNSIGNDKDCQVIKEELSSKTSYVKISMDGVPFLRKVDLGCHSGYSELVDDAFEKLFGCFGIGDALKDSENSEYVPIYEDKDGDWMLLGDVPWKMFTESCKRLRIMKRSDAKGYYGLVQSKKRHPKLLLRMYSERLE